MELNLAELIDVKGQKAMGNRLSQHEVQKVSLLASAEPEPLPAPQPSPMPAVKQEEELPAPMEEATPSLEPTAQTTSNEVATPLPELDEFADAAPLDEKIAPQPEPVEMPKPTKDIGFEITNPDEVDIDDKGQLGLF